MRVGTVTRIIGVGGLELDIRPLRTHFPPLYTVCLCHGDGKDVSSQFWHLIGGKALFKDDESASSHVSTLAKDIKDCCRMIRDSFQRQLCFTSLSLL